jgi:hypothetical protein
MTEEIIIAGYPLSRLSNCSMQTLQGILDLYKRGYASEKHDYLCRGLPPPVPGIFAKEIIALSYFIEALKVRV